MGSEGGGERGAVRLLTDRRLPPLAVACTSSQTVYGRRGRHFKLLLAWPEWG
jgi:hypothetical protein